SGGAKCYRVSETCRSYGALESIYTQGSINISRLRRWLSLPRSFSPRRLQNHAHRNYLTALSSLNRHRSKCNFPKAWTMESFSTPAEIIHAYLVCSVIDAIRIRQFPNFPP